MGKRGPVPKSSQQRRLEGNPSKRPIPERPAPKPQRNIPTCPSFLPDEAKREWRRVAPELIRMGILTKLDRAGLAAYCTCYARWQQATNMLAGQGNTYVTPKGQVRERPEVEIARKSQEMMKMFAEEYGLTPTSRARIAIPAPGNSDSGDDFIEAMLKESEKGNRP